MSPRLSFCLILLFLLAGARGSSVPADPLAGLRSAWVEALEQRDLEGSLALFTPDAIFLTPDGGRYDDRAAIRTLYRNVLATYRSRISLTSKREEIGDKLCVDEGTYSETLTETATGKELPLTGSYLLVAKRETGQSWKIAELVWTGGAH